MRQLSTEVQAWLRNPVRHALQTEHAALRIGTDTACRYPGEYIPFAGLATRKPQAFEELYELLAPGEPIYIIGEEPLTAASGFVVLEEIAGLQMVYAGEDRVRPGVADTGIELLGPGDVPEMIRLKEIAFPGFYGPRAPELGIYYGVKAGEELVAMAGERLAMPGMREVSAVCTHPSYTGRGYAARLIMQVVDRHLQAGLVSFLHLALNNRRALALYERLGFVGGREVRFQQIQRVG